jgi:hypothetical protein
MRGRREFSCAAIAGIVVRRRDRSDLGWLAFVIQITPLDPSL